MSTPDQPLTAEVVRVLEAHPTLGADGFFCPFTQSAASFPTDREAAFQPAFTQAVATILDCMTRWPPGFAYPTIGRGYAQMCGAGVVELPIGAVIVAFLTAGVKFSRIAGTSDIAIARRRRGRA